MSKEKLSIEVAQVDCIEINNMNLPEACEDKILEKLASDSTSSHHQYAGLEWRC
jgi:hypothetical protein